MNKKNLSFLALGLLISSPAFSSESGKGKKRIQETNSTSRLSTTNIEKANKPVDSDDEDAAPAFDMTGYSNVMRMFQDQADIPEPKIVQQLANMSAKDAWKAIKDDDQSSIASSIMPGAKKKNKKKKGGPKDSALVLTVQSYYDPLDGEIITTEQTVEAMQALLKKYSAVFGLLKREQSNANKKRRFSQDSQNKLTAYEKAQNKVRATIKDLKQNAGSKKAAMDMKQRTEAENAFNQSLEGKAQVAAEKRKLKAQERKSIEQTPARPTIMSEQEQARMDEVISSMIEQQTNKVPKFLLEQNLPYDNDMTRILQIVADYVHPEQKKHSTTSVHACPVHGEVHTKPCTIRLAKNQEKSATECEMQKRHEVILSHWIKAAQSEIDGNKPFAFRGENTSGSPIYDLFTAFAREVKESKINNKVGNMGSVADRFKFLLKYKFEVVESEESQPHDRTAEYTTLYKEKDLNIQNGFKAIEEYANLPENHDQTYLHKVLSILKDRVNPGTSTVEVYGINNTSNETMPREFTNNKIMLFTEAIKQLFWLAIGEEKEITTLTCPVCGKINNEYCTIKLDKTLNNKIIPNSQEISEAKEKLNNIIRLAKNNTMSTIDKYNPAYPAAYNLFLSLVNKAKEGKDDISMSSIGELAFKFKGLLTIPFQHATPNKSKPHARTAEDTTLYTDYSQMIPEKDMIQNIMNRMNKVDILDADKELSAFAIRLKKFAEKVSIEDQATIIDSFCYSTDKTSIEVNWCPACLICHPEKVKVQNSSIPLEGPQIFQLCQIIEKHKEDKNFKLIQMLAYSNWSHAE